MLLQRKKGSERVSFLSAMACPLEQKRATEAFWLKYAVVWVACFAVIIGGRMYAWFDRHHYMIVCGGLATPLLLQPFLAPGITGEASLPWNERHCVKATVWIAIFSIIGNYWYTHYFYSVLKASYSMPAFDLNGVTDRTLCQFTHTIRVACVAHMHTHMHNWFRCALCALVQVPLAMYFATHFYFTLYHALAGGFRGP